MKRGPLSPRSAGFVVDASNTSARLVDVDVRNFRDAIRGSFAGGRVPEEGGDENVAPPGASAVAKKRRNLVFRLKLGGKARLMATGRGKHKNDQATGQSFATTDSGQGENDQATSHSTTITPVVVTKPASMPQTSADASSDTPKSSSLAVSAERKEITSTAVVTELATTHVSSTDYLPPMDPSRDQTQSSNTTKPSTAGSSDPPKPSSTAASNEAFSVFSFKHRHVKRPITSSPHGEKNFKWIASIDTVERDVAIVKKDDVVVLEKTNKQDGALTVTEASCWSQATRAFMSCGTLALFAPEAKDTATVDYDQIEKHDKHHQTAIVHPNIPRACSYPVTSHDVRTSARLIDRLEVSADVRQKNEIQCTHWAAFGANKTANAWEGLSHLFMKTGPCTDELLNCLVEMKERAPEEARKAIGQATVRIDELLKQLTEMKSATCHDEVELKKEAADARAHIIEMERAIGEKSIALTKEQDQRMELEYQIIQLNQAITSKQEQEWVNRQVIQGMDQKISSLEYDVEAARKSVLEMAVKDIKEDLVNIQVKHSQEAGSMQNLGEVLERMETKLSKLELELQDTDADAGVMQIEIESLQSQEEHIESLLEEVTINELENEPKVNENMSSITSIKESLMQSSSNNEAREYGMNTNEDESVKSASGASTASSGHSCPASVVTVTKSSSKSEFLEPEMGEMGESFPDAEFDSIPRNEQSTSSPVKAIPVVQSSLNDEDSNLELQLKTNVNAAPDNSDEYYKRPETLSLTGSCKKKRSWLQKLSMTLSLSRSLESDDAKLATKSQMSDLSSITKETGSIEYSNLSKEAEDCSSVSESDKVESNSCTDSSVGSSTSENNPRFTVFTPEGLSGEVLESKSWPRSHVGVSHSLSQTENLNPVFAAQSGSADEGLAIELVMSGEFLEGKSWPRSNIGVSHSLSQTDNLNPVLAAQSGSAEGDSALELDENIPTSHYAESVECVPDNSEEYCTRSQSPSLRASGKNKQRRLRRISMKSSTSNDAMQTIQFQQVNMANSSITTWTGSIENSSLSFATELSTSIENSSLSTETSASVSDIDESTTSEYSSVGFPTPLSTPFLVQ